MPSSSPAVAWRPRAFDCGSELFGDQSAWQCGREIPHLSAPFDIDVGVMSALMAAHLPESRLQLRSALLRRGSASDIVGQSEGHSAAYA